MDPTQADYTPPEDTSGLDNSNAATPEASPAFSTEEITAFKQRYAEHSTPEVQNITGTVNQLTPEEEAARYKEPKPLPAPVVGPPPLPARYSNPWTSSLQFIGDHFKLNDAEMTAGAAGYELFTQQGLTDAQLKEKMSGLDVKEMQSLQNDVSIMDKRLGDFNPVKWAGVASSFLPFMMKTTQQGLVRGAEGAAAGAAAGAGLGAIFGGITAGPAAAAAGAVAGGTSGATEGLGAGFAYGTFEAAAKITTGQTFNELIKQGYSQQTARGAAATIGIASGIMQAAQVHLMSGVAKQAFINEMNGAAGQKFIQAQILKYSQEYGLNIAAADAQTMSHDVTKYMAAQVDNHPEKAPTLQQMLQNLRDTTVAAAEGTPFIMGGAHIVGSVGGKVMTSGKEVIGTKGASVREAVQAVTAGMQEQRATPQEVQATTDTPNSTILDSLVKPPGPEPVSQQGAMVSIDPVTGEVTLHSGVQENAAVPATAAETTTPAEAPPQVKVTEVGKPVEQPDGTHTVTVTGEDNQNYQYTFDNADAAKSFQAGVGKGDALDTGNATPLGQAMTPELTARVARIKEDTQRTDTAIADAEKQVAVHRRLVEVKSRLKEIAQELSNTKGVLSKKLTEKLDGLRTEQSDLKLERVQLEKQALKVKPHVTLENTLTKLYDLRGNLDLEHALIKEGLLTPEEIQKAKGTMTVGKIFKLRAKAANEVLKSFKKGLREGVVTTKAGVKDIQNQLVSLIRDSGMEAKDRAKFIQSIKNVQTPEQLAKAIPKIQERIKQAIEEHNRKEALSDTKGLLEKTKLSKNGKFQVGKYTADIQTVLDIYRKAFHEKGYLAKVAATLQDKANSGEPLTHEDMLHAAIAETMSGLKDSHSSTIKSVNEEIQSLMDTGKAKNLENKIARQEEIQRSIKAAKESLQGNKPAETDPARSPKSLEKKGPWTTVKGFLRTFGHQLDPWNMLLSLLGQDDPRVKEGQRPTILDEFDINPVMKVRDKVSKQWEERLREKLSTAFGKVKNSELMRHIISGNDRVYVGEMVSADGKREPLTLSFWEGVKVYMEMQDPTLRAGLEQGNRYSFRDTHPLFAEQSTEAIVEGFIGKDGMAVGDNLLQHFREFYKEFVNPYWRETRGVDLPFNEFYSPVMRRVEKANEAETPFDRINRSTTPTSAVERTKNAHPLELQNALQATVNHLGDWISFVSGEDWYNKTSRFVNSAEVKKIIIGKYGEGVYKNFRSLWERQAGVASVKGQMFQALNNVMNRASLAYIGFRIATFPRHLAATVGYLNYVPVGDFVASVLDGAKNPKNVVDTLNQHPSIASRSGHMGVGLLELSNSREWQQFSHSKTFSDWMMLPTTSSSAVEKYLGAWAVYQHALKEGMTHEQALDKANTVSKELSFGGTMDTRSNFQFNHPLVGKFGTIMFKHASLVRRAIRNVVSNPSPATTAQALKTAAVLGVFLPALDVQIMHNLGGQHSQEAGDKTAAEAFSSLIGLHVPVATEIIDTIILNAFNVMFDHHNKTFDTSTAPAQLADDVTGAAHQAIKYAKDPDFETAMKVIRHLSRINILLPAKYGGTLPLPAMEKAVEGMFGIDATHTTSKSDYDKALNDLKD